MKTIFKTLALLPFLCGSVTARDKPKIGFIRIVNAISPGAGKASFLINGNDLYPDGYALGQTTGGYGVDAGPLEVEVRKAGVGKGGTRIHLEAGETMTVIAYAERVATKNPDEPPKWELKLLRLKQQEAAGRYGLSLVSVRTAEETAVELAVTGRNKVEKAFAKRLTISKTDLGRVRGEVMVRLGARVLTIISPDSPGNYVVILYESAEGRVEALSYYDPKFVIAG